MEPTLNQLKDNYASRTTEELIEIRATRQLTSTAVTALDGELHARGVGESDVSTVREARQTEAREREALAARLAPLASRAIAYLIDFHGTLLVTGLLMVPLFAWPDPAPREMVMRLFLLGWVGYVLFKDGFNGQSVGKRLLRMQVVGKTSGEPCSFGSSCLRNVAQILGIFDWAFIFGTQRQRLGDQAADTLVVRKSR